MTIRLDVADLSVTKVDADTLLHYWWVVVITKIALLLLICDSGLARFAARWCQRWWVLEPADVSVT